MQNKMHTIWLTTLTLIALLLSSVASGTSLMPLQMAIANQIPTSHQMTDSHFLTELSDKSESHCNSSQEIAPVTDQVCCDSEQMHSDHQCCPANSVTSYTVIIVSESSYIQPSSLILFSKEPTRRISSIASALYKPPIA